MKQTRLSLLALTLALSAAPALAQSDSPRALSQRSWHCVTQIPRPQNVIAGADTIPLISDMTFQMNAYDLKFSGRSVQTLRINGGDYHATIILQGTGFEGAEKGLTITNQSMARADTLPGGLFFTTDSSAQSLVADTSSGLKLKSRDGKTVCT